MVSEQVTEQLKVLEKCIQSAESLKQNAITKKGMYEEQLLEVEKELKELGTTPEKVDEYLMQLENEIQTSMQVLKDTIPFDLLLKWKLIDENDIKILGLK